MQALGGLGGWRGIIAQLLDMGVPSACSLGKFLRAFWCHFLRPRPLPYFLGATGFSDVLDNRDCALHPFLRLPASSGVLQPLLRLPCLFAQVCKASQRGGLL